MASVYRTQRNPDGTYSVTGRSSDGVTRTVPIALGEDGALLMSDCEAALDAAIQPARRKRVTEPQPIAGSQE